MAYLKYSSNKSEFIEYDPTFSTESYTFPSSTSKSNIQSYGLGLQMHIQLKECFSFPPK
jgi:hypothetical protein